MVYRKFNAPNVEYNEIDRSQYGVVNDGAAVGTMTFIAGFADRGDDYDAKYSRSFPDFIQSYGYPTNEAERYFYNAAKEVFAAGGRTITSKIPYDNESKNKFAFTVYASDGALKEISDSEFGDGLSAVDPSITSYFEVESVEKDSLMDYLSVFNSPADSSGLMTMEQYDELLVGNVKPKENSVYVVDIVRNKYSKDPNLIDLEVYETANFLGYVPVVVSPMNALYFQKLLDYEDPPSADMFKQNPFNVASTMQTIPNTTEIFVPSSDSEPSAEHAVRTNQVDFDDETVLKDFAIQIESSEMETETVSKIAASYFPSIKFFSENKLDRTYLKQIGVVVFRMASDASNEGKIAFTPVESFVGSLDRRAKDPTTGNSVFIDDVVNNSSQTINLFSNFDFSEKRKIADSQHETVVASDLDRASTIVVRNQTLTTLGFFESQCVKKITAETIEESLDTILDNCKDPNAVPIDIVCDAGTSNIAQYMKLMSDKTLFYDPEFDFNGEFSINGPESTKEWRKIVMKFDNFTKNVRKDCIFIADGLRSLCLVGNSKIVRKTAPKNTISNSIVPKIRYMLPPNSSYSAGYCNWFRCIDGVSNSYFWCPPSIKALGAYLYTDRYANTWDAPAGDNRGRITDAYDVAFNPTVEEAQSFYEQQWNYAVAYPLNGIVLEGQKTFQTDKTALDRVNVRRLCLALKKGIKEIARWFKYENITQQVLTRFRDQLQDLLQRVKLNSGISEFFIKLDEDNNTPETADRNEIHAAIAIRPIKSAEFIIINSIVVNQSADLEEVTQSVLS